ncbi:hypothetical protein [Mesorhizobium sp. IMUNJ 23232]|uniref:hypothetical protein n=1 Tax=Mesorhizobium sp. IMUNJ 23232 TaxID=3376064 RepID=UPI00378BD558
MADDRIDRPFPADEEERQMILAKLRPKVEWDPKTETMRGLFELLVLYVGMVAFALGVATAVDWTMREVITSVEWKWRIGIAVVFFLGTIVVINQSFDGEDGERRRANAERLARRYGYPITLAVGLWGGTLLQEHWSTTSQLGEAKDAAVRACLQLPKCVTLAGVLNDDDPVQWIIDPPKVAQ